MKKIFLTTLLLTVCFLLTVLHAQIYTPKGVYIEAYTYTEGTPSQIAALEAAAAQWISDHHSAAVRVAPASFTYNCHGYAWHKSDGGANRWVYQLTSAGNPNLSKYWSGSNPTFSSANPDVATKTFYTNGDHSATQISSSNFCSKWGAWPRYNHSPNDCPYTLSGIQYYTIPVTGADLLCTSGTYNTTNIASSTYSWTGSGVTISGSSNSVTATANPSYNKLGAVSCSIACQLSGTTIHGYDSIWVGAPSFNTIYGPSSTPNHHEASFYVVPNIKEAITNYTWNLNPLNGNTLFPSGPSLIIAFYNAGYY